MTQQQQMGLVRVVIPLIGDLGEEEEEITTTSSFLHPLQQDETESTDKDEYNPLLPKREEQRSQVELLIEAPVPAPAPMAAQPYLRKMEETSSRLSSSILSASSSLAQSIYEKAERYKATTEPRDDPLQVPEAVRTVISTSRSALPYVSRASSVAVGLVSEVVMVAASKVASLTPSRGEEEVVEGVSNSTVFSSIASKGFEEGWKIWSACATASKQLLDASTDSLADVVNHTYGWNAAQTVREGITTGVDILTTSQQTTCGSVGALGATSAVTKILAKKQLQELESRGIDIELKEFTPLEGEVGEGENAEEKQDEDSESQRNLSLATTDLETISSRAETVTTANDGDTKGICKEADI